MRINQLILAAAFAALGTTAVHADQLDDIISSGKLRCAVELDFSVRSAQTIENGLRWMTVPVPLAARDDCNLRLNSF